MAWDARSELLAVSADGQEPTDHPAPGSDHHRVVWSPTDGSLVGGWVEMLKILPQLANLPGIYQSCDVTLWRLDGSHCDALSFSSRPACSGGLFMSPDGAWLLGAQSSSMTSYDVARGKTTATWYANGSVGAIAWRPDEAAASGRGVVSLETDERGRRTVV